MTLIIKLLLTAVTLFVTATMVQLLWSQWSSLKPVALTQKLKLATAGFVANVADTIGVGSFAVLVAFNKYWKMVDDRELPGTLNAQSPLPTLVQALFFLTAVTVEMKTLIALIIGSSVGGFIGGVVVAGLEKQRIRKLMLVGYIGIAGMIITSKLGLLPVGGELMSLHGVWLVAGVLGMLVAGILPAIGVGAYAPIQVILFLLGMSPLAAFPIMSASAAVQQSVAAYAFIQRGQVPLKASSIIGLAGILGVFVAAPLVTYVNPEKLRWLLLAVVVYNVFMLWKTFSTKPMVEQPA